jgi:glycine/D-amino acid oxidase-like deaminating enzyme
LSPRGKLVAFGTEGLTATNQLIKMVDDDSFILRNELYRLASSPEQLQFLKQTAENFPQIAEYIPGEKLRESQIIDGNSIVSGGLRLHNGCKVIFMPGYLKALWRSCERLAISRSSTISWRKVNTQTIDESSYDVVVYAAGSGMWSDKHEVENNFSKLPVTLVRGQSLVMEAQCKEALLCGKYISPTPNQMHTLLGATHEFRENPLSSDALITELKARTQSFVPKLWENHQILQITSGVRVQSDRGKYGRMPIIGKLSNQQDRWLFTGLSSRGLLYHGLFADVLADAILSDSEEPILQRDWLWWKKITTM